MGYENIHLSDITDARNWYIVLHTLVNETLISISSIVDLSPLRNLHIFERWSFMRTGNLYKILNELSTWKRERAIDLVNYYDQLFDFSIGTTDICFDIFSLFYFWLYKRCGWSLKIRIFIELLVPDIACFVITDVYFLSYCWNQSLWMIEK